MGCQWARPSAPLACRRSRDSCNSRASVQEKEAAAVDAGKKKDLTAQERLEEAKKALQAQAVRIASIYTLTSVVPCAPVAPLVARTVIAILHFVLSDPHST